jgi:hypothetical protein
MLPAKTILDLISAALVALAIWIMAQRAPQLAGFLSETLHDVSVAGIGLLGLCVVVYAFSHLLRIMRLYLTLGEVNVTVTQLLRFQFTVSLLGAFLPLRLGDVLRFVELARVTNRATAVLIAVVIERSLDVTMVLLLLGLLWWSGNAGSGMAPIALITAGSLLAALGLFFVGPLALRSLANTALTRGRSWRSLAILRVCEAILRAAAQFPGPDLGRLVALALLTVAIWVAEIAVFFAAGSAAAAFTGTPLWSDPILGVLSTALGTSAGAQGAAAYRLIVVLVLGAGAMIYALPYLKRRFRGIAAEARSRPIYRLGPIPTRRERRAAVAAGRGAP